MDEMREIYRAQGSLQKDFVGQISYTVCLPETYKELDICFSFEKQHYAPEDLTPERMEEIRSLWQGGGYIRAEPLDVHYYRELAKYMTKEAREFGRPKPGERTWRASRNLQKPVVEYIEIPSESVTLAAPFGAVDYETFHEKNPYGFADCLGARYLLFPQRPREEYSYTKPRARDNRTP